MAGEIVYADIKHTSSEHSSSLQRSGKLDLELLLKLMFYFKSPCFCPVFTSVLLKMC